MVLLARSELLTSQEVGHLVSYEEAGVHVFDEALAEAFTFSLTELI